MIQSCRCTAGRHDGLCKMWSGVKCRLVAEKELVALNEICSKGEYVGMGIVYIFDFEYMISGQ